MNQDELVIYDSDPQSRGKKSMSQLHEEKIKGLLCADNQNDLHDLWKLQYNVIINYDICNPTAYMKRAASCGVENKVVHVISFLAKGDNEFHAYNSLLHHLNMEGHLLTFNKNQTASS
ncbi:hypothetical protein RFI_12598 [Reticulomyxa filosa]|uniref:Uncharacterized protein n=1 Tax=Reticulomyxa filosa TaxID=46433 RepID=X6NE08_RETFI|nr:hypothetical protein RFI_12598 [Reticulomyxa filosa]|eukprot:ETO24560.1 hypothetical protein RFI_12598 [Reticulomyxa filosa]